MAAGQTLTHYEILAPLGVGDREVAIKVLPAELACEAEHLTRFEREAKVLASLNHPNVAQVFDFDQPGGALPRHVDGDLDLQGSALQAFLEVARAPWR